MSLAKTYLLLATSMAGCNIPLQVRMYSMENWHSVSNCLTEDGNNNLCCLFAGQCHCWGVSHQARIYSSLYLDFLRLLLGRCLQVVLSHVSFSMWCSFDLFFSGWIGKFLWFVKIYMLFFLTKRKLMVAWFSMDLLVQAMAIIF